MTPKPAANVFLSYLTSSHNACVFHTCLKDSNFAFFGLSTGFLPRKPPWWYILLPPWPNFEQKHLKIWEKSRKIYKFFVFSTLHNLGTSSRARTEHAQARITACQRLTQAFVLNFHSFSHILMDLVISVYVSFGKLTWQSWTLVEITWFWSRAVQKSTYSVLACVFRCFRFSWKSW